MYKHTSEKGFSVLLGLLVIVVLAAAGLGSWYVWDQQNEDTETADTSQSQKSSDENASPQSQSAEITDLGIKINDPDNRDLTVKKQDVQLPAGLTSTVYTVTPADYSNTVCETPGYVASATEEEALASTSTAFKYKKIGDSYFVVGGTILGCGDDTPGWQDYITELTTYIYDNLVSLE